MTSTRRNIEFAPATRRAPPEVCARARTSFEQLAESLASIPEESPFWGSMRASTLYLQQGGWSFLYRLDGRAVRVDDVRAQ